MCFVSFSSAFDMPKVPVMRTTAVDLILPNMPSLDVHDGWVGITKQEVILMYPGCTIHGIDIIGGFQKETSIFGKLTCGSVGLGWAAYCTARQGEQIGR